MSAANNAKLMACHTAFLQNVSRENAYALYEPYGYALTQEPLSRGHETYNFGRGFRSHHYYLQLILVMMTVYYVISVITLETLNT